MPNRKSRKDLPSRVYFKNNAYYFVTLNKKWIRLGKNYIEALQEYTKLNQSNKPVFTMGQLFDRYLIEIIPTKAKATQEDNLNSLKFLRLAFGEMLPSEITPQDIYAYMDARKAPVRANRDKALLSHVFKKAIRWGVTDFNPCRDVESNPEKPRDRLVTPGEFWLVHDLCENPMLRVAMKLAAITGLRQNKILSLEVKHLKETCIEIDSGKRGLKLSIERTDELNEVLTEAQNIYDISSIYIIHTRKGQPYSSSGFKSIWKRWRDKALDNGLKESYTFHDLRAMAGSETNDIDLLGHKNKSTYYRVYKRGFTKVKPVSIRQKGSN